jgi:two-component system cell cycle response regulator DivK
MDGLLEECQETLSSITLRDGLTLFAPLRYNGHSDGRIPEPKSNIELMPARIIIADDYADNRELLRLLLSVAGYEILEARDGLECLRMVMAEMPDLVLIDISMPLLDGWGVLRELRADERTRAIPCVAFTALAELNHERARERGFDAYIAKPFNGKDLLETVARLLAPGGTHEDRNYQPGSDGIKVNGG